LDLTPVRFRSSHWTHVQKRASDASLISHPVGHRFQRSGASMAWAEKLCGSTPSSWDLCRIQGCLGGFEVWLNLPRKAGAGTSGPTVSLCRVSPPDSFKAMGFAAV